MSGQTKHVGSAMALVMLAGLAVSTVHGGVQEIVWVEVNNSVGTIGEAAGVPTGLDGMRTFDLYAMVTPGTRLWAADFGYVGANQGYDDNMWTTQSVYQNEFGSDVQSAAIGAMSQLAALEFDTYVGLGMLDSRIVMNTSILGGNWSPAMFEVAWFGTQYVADAWVPATGDVDGKVFLARISVSSSGGYAQATGENEFLGGVVFLSGEDDAGEFGQHDPASGLFVALNAFPEDPIPMIAASNGNDSGMSGTSGSSGVGGDGAPEDEGLPSGDLNGDGVFSGTDLSLMQRVFGSISNPEADLNGDGIVSDIDMQMLLDRIGSSAGTAAPAAPGADEWAGVSPKERKKLEKLRRQKNQQRLKAQRKAEKQAEKERKQIEKQRRKEEKRMEKERKKREKQAN